MATRLPIIVSVLALMSATGCKKNEQGKADDGPAGGADPGAGATAADGPGKTDEMAATNPGMPNRMKHCPAAVDGAGTSVEKTDESVHVIITAREASGTAQVRERVAHLAKVVSADSSDAKHTGEGTGGAIGKCPAIQKGVAITFEEIDNGIKVVLTPVDAARLDEVYQTAAARARSLTRRGGKAHGTGTGGGHGAGEGGRHGGGQEGKERKD